MAGVPSPGGMRVPQALDCGGLTPLFHPGPPEMNLSQRPPEDADTRALHIQSCLHARPVQSQSGVEPPQSKGSRHFPHRIRFSRVSPLAPKFRTGPSHTTTMKRILTLITALLSLFSALHAAPAKPNIIFILADDLGFAEIGANGADHYKTPNIDSLAKTGIRFSHFYTAPLCGPSRALILTGRYAFRSGAVTQAACASILRTGDKAEVMIPTVLKKAGYTTAMIGKWGQLLPSGDAAEWGFDHMLSFRASGIYWNKAAAASWVKKYALAGDKGAY